MSSNGSPTFLFADLVGFTALTARNGDDDAADLAVAFSATVRDLAQRHSAEVVKAIGDAVMVRADDPVQAVALGERIVADLPRDGFPEVRVGMHTGPAVERDGDWYGSTVNFASRLTDIARAGEVLLSGETRDGAGLDGNPRLKRRGRFAFRRPAGRLAIYALTSGCVKAPTRRCVRQRARDAGAVPFAALRRTA